MQNLFSGLRVIDFTNNAAGPSSTALLADFGAEVIKIERPGTGDDSRMFAPQVEGVGVTYCWMNRGKKSIVLDMEEPRAREIARKLIANADLVVESFKPGTMKNFGLDYDSVKQFNPRIIFCSVSAFGQTGPDSSKPGYDGIAQAISGVMDLTGEPDGPPTRVGVMLADYGAGVFAFSAMSAALYHRERTGQGQHIDISLLDCLVSINGSVEPAGLGRKPTRTGNHSPVLTPFGIFQGNGEAIIICSPAQKPWQSLCKVMGREEMIGDPLYRDNAARAANQGLLTVEIEKWLQTFDSVDEPLSLLDKAGVPCAKVNSTVDLLENRQLLEREMIIDLAMPDGISVQSVKARGNPLKFSGAKAVLRKAPTLGQHQEEILTSLGYDGATITGMKKTV